ncbi:MAG: TIGR03668 family PPOX class F420-dependent oxidoreductase [Acidobacteria bacterium]|nr:MAG: TIGR03668 family PPOX class F420-dependent oxidoreductase [Acidobacteriota bacterium]PYV01981.1 MAG: TIGR03668 family PPOX class F420-dependent oxidoreductase [Acidobacteriota bacterium]PYV42115.1 MAG: TIGR03668 family PPOX class F420-dependent oxidoreductase [Acidobacteriota bacterium]
MSANVDENFLRTQRVGHLATVDARGRPVVVPFCFVYDGKAFYSSLDEKAKKVSPEKLRRTQNIRVNPEVALVIDHYEEDWGKLKFVLIRGRARILYSGKEHGRAIELLREKYAQYRSMRLENRPVLKIVPWRIREWTAE